MTKPEKTDKVVTPRGKFNFGFETREQATENGFELWFTHNDIDIFNDGTTSLAIRKPNGVYQNRKREECHHKSEAWEREDDGPCPS